MKTKSKSKVPTKSRRKASQLPGGNCRILANFLRDNQMKQREFAEKTGIKEHQLSRMNVGAYVPTEEDQEKMISAGMPEKDVKAFAKAVRRFKGKAFEENVGSVRKASVKKQSRSTPKVKSSRRTSQPNGSISKEGVAALQRVTDRYDGKISADLALIIMEECS